MQRWVVICWALLALVSAEQCPDRGTCGDGQTCCNDPDNGFECCPFDQAECCEDHAHCCPADTVCDEATSSCVNATVSVPWAERTNADQSKQVKSFRMIKAYMGEDDSNVCPDESRCPPEFSCLKALTKYGCCPLAQGVPCADGKHCCPEGHECSADCRSCIKQETVTTVMCSDGVSECPDQTTCCETPEGKWACCPVPKAVCCEDKLHCCPEGSTCDVEHSKCISLSTRKEMPMWAKLPARIRADWENVNDGEHVTSQAADDDSVTSANTVPPSDGEMPTSSVTRGAGGNDVPCDETVGCPDGSTCCKDQEGSWSCCPLPEAVCCSDDIHCCPKGKTCNLTAQTCEDATCSTPLFKKMPAIPRVGDVPCDSGFSCEDGTTCCKNTEGGWSCCPLPEAVCCDDMVHCCPKGKKCNLEAQTCDDPAGSTPWLEKVPAIPGGQDVRVGNVTCDSTKSCEDGSTCCKKEDGSWACCPLPDAVCCEDHEHCCPSGTTCDLTALTCVGVSSLTPMWQKVPALSTEAPSTPDATTTPLDTPSLVQTEEPNRDNDDDDDGDDDGDGDDRDDDDYEGESKDPEDRVRCDSHTSCPQGTTCCFMAASHKWGCCPLPEAVCCSDGNHCCPTDFKCDESQTSCVKGEVQVPWYTKLPATTTPTGGRDEPGSVQCNGQSQCPERTTCCRLSTGEWGCCPLQNAVCCPDQEHCCPQGYTCDIASSSCQKVIMLQLETVPLTPVYLPEPRPQPSPLRHGEVKCDDTTSCEDGQTCCRTSATTWGCCPLPNAVCCSDMQHCCPAGSTCTDEGSCTQNTRLHWHDWHMFFSNKKRALTV